MRLVASSKPLHAHAVCTSHCEQATPCTPLPRCYHLGCNLNLIAPPMTPPPTCPRQARSGPKWTGALNHASELAVALAPAHAATLCLANMSCCGRLCLRRSHLRALGRHDGLERPPRGLRREGCCQRYLGGGGESRAGGASHHGPRPPPSCAAGERASDS